MFFISRSQIIHVLLKILVFLWNVFHIKFHWHKRDLTGVSVLFLFQIGFGFYFYFETVKLCLLPPWYLPSWQKIRNSFEDARVKDFVDKSSVYKIPNFLEVHHSKHGLWTSSSLPNVNAVASDLIETGLCIFW